MASTEIEMRSSILGAKPLPRPLSRQLVGYLAYWNPYEQRHNYVCVEVVDA